MTPEDLAKGDGLGQALLRLGEATGWEPHLYAAGRAIPPGKAAWIAFVRANPVEELRLAWDAWGASEEASSTPGGGVSAQTDEGQTGVRLTDE